MPDGIFDSRLVTQASTQAAQRQSGRFRTRTLTSPLALALEPRFMFDAAGVATGGEAAVDAAAQEAADQQTDNPQPENQTDPLAEALSVTAPPADRKEVVFVDPNVGNFEALIAGVHPAAQVVVLNPAGDGLQQIADYMADQSDIDAVHIISHGEAGSVSLGGMPLDLAAIDTRSETLAQIGDALTANGDILFYGCDVAAGDIGGAFVSALAEATGADIAASTDTTGAAELGGDWDLESETGTVEADLAISEQARAAYAGILDDDIEVTVEHDIWDWNGSAKPSGDVTLREAVAWAQNQSGTITITFADVVDEVRLNSQTDKEADAPDIDITKGNIVIDGDRKGDGTPDVIIYADNDRSSGNPVGRAFEIRGDAVVELVGLTIRDGWARNSQGGAIWAYGTANVTIRDSVITANRATSGGGIAVSGGSSSSDGATVKIIDSDITDNDADGFGFQFEDGGGILAYGYANLELDGVTVSGNEARDLGGGIGIFEDADMTVSNSVITDNDADEDGGGLYWDGITGRIETTTISDNTAGNDGGGIFVYWSGLTIDRSTISGNHADDDGGGILLETEPLTITNSTISGNTADDNGGGIEFEADDFEFTKRLDILSLTHVTIANNTADYDNDGDGLGGGLYLEWVVDDDDVTIDAQVHVLYSIIAENHTGGSSSPSGDDIYFDGISNLNTNAQNLLGVSNRSSWTEIEDAGIKPLGDYGGPTETHALEGDSRAVNGAANSSVTVDQRGFTRPSNGQDIGAVEGQPPVAEDDTVTVKEDSGGTVLDLLGNDGNVDDDTLRVNAINGKPVEEGRVNTFDLTGGTLEVGTDGQITFTPAANYHGSFTFNYGVTDGTLTSDRPGIVTVTVTPVDDRLFVNPDAYSVDEDQVLTVPALEGLIANDQNPNDAPVITGLVSDVSNGTLQLNPDGGFTYTPDPNFSGTDSFRYVLREPGHDAFARNAELVTITVNPVNDAPVFADGLVPAFEQSFVTDTAGVLDADDGRHGTVAREVSGTNGIVSPDGVSHARVEQGTSPSLSGIRGPYTAFDGFRDTWTGDWEAEVKVYLDTNWADDEGFDYSVASNGSDGNHQRDFIFHVSKDISTGKLLVGASNNTNFDPRQDLDTINHAEVPESGWYTLKHRFYDAGGVLAVDMMLIDDSGTTLFTETRSDPSDTIGPDGEVGGNRYGWFTNIDVTGGIAIDALTLAIPGSEGQVTELADGDPGENTATLTQTGTLPFVDVDLTDSHTVLVNPVGNDYRGTLKATVINPATGDGDGVVEWTFSVDDAALDDLAAGETLTQTYEVTVDDGNGGTDTQDVVITITGSNDGPIIDSPAQTGTIIETVDLAPTDDADPTDATGTITFDDVDLSDEPTAEIARSVVTSGTVTDDQAKALLDGLTLGTLVKDPSDGSGSIGWTYSVDNAAIDFLGANDTVVLTFTVTIDDQNDGTDTQDVVITINGANDAPIIDSPPQTGTITETVDLAPTDDADPTDATGTITFDDVDLSDEPTAEITRSVVTSGTVTDDQAKALLDGLTLGTLVKDPSDGSGSVGWTYSVDNAAIDFLGANDTVVLTFTVTIDDQNDGTDTQDVVITINGANDAPIIDSPAQTGTITETVDLAPTDDADPTDATGTITFDDVDLSDEPTAEITRSVVTSGTVTDDQAKALLDGLTLGTLVKDPSDGSGSVGWTYSVDNAAIDFLGANDTVVLTFTVTIDDQNDGTDTQDVVITINGANDAPIIDSPPQTGTITETADNGLAPDDDPADVTGTITFDDVDLSDEPTAEITRSVVTSGTVTDDQAKALLDGLTLGTLVKDPSDGSGSVGWTYSVDNAAIDFLGANDTVVLTFTVTIDDQNDGTDTQDVVITINGANDAPIIDSPPQTGTITETADNGLAPDDDPADVTGTITFDDVDLSDEPTAEITRSVVTSGTVTDDQAKALLDGLKLDTLVKDPSDGSGEVDWTYSVDNAAIDFLGANDTVVLTFTVTIDDQNDGTDTQDVVITINGTNDAPIIDSQPQSRVITETADNGLAPDDDPADVTGTITYKDVDLSDEPTALITRSVVTSGTVTDDQAKALLDGLKLGTLVKDPSDGSGEVDWTYSVTNAEIDFLGANDEVVLTFTVTIDDGNDGTDTQDVVITIKGTNDAPIIDDSQPQSGVITETADNGLAPDDDPADVTGTITYKDVDLSDEPTALITRSVVTSGTVTDDQANTLLDGLKLGTLVKDPSDGSGEVDWTYSVDNAAIDFLGANDEVVLTFTVTIDDGNDGTDTQDVVITIKGTNDAPIIDDSQPQTGTITETADNGLAPDDDPADVTGTITYKDVDLSDEPTALITRSVVTSGTVTDDQAKALLDGLKLGTLVKDPSDGSGEVDWTYSVTNAEIDFLGANDEVVLTFTVTIDDGNDGTDTQDVVITIKGTNDAPIIDDSQPQSGVITETADNGLAPDDDPADATGTITYKDVDLSDEPTALITRSVVTSGTVTDDQANTLLDGLKLGTLVKDPSDGSGEVDWTYSVDNAAIDFLGANDEVVLTFTVTIDDQNDGTDTQDVVITIKGTNDAPIIDSPPQTGTITETVDLAPADDADPTDATGTITFDDVDLSDVPTASATGTVSGGTATLTQQQQQALLDNLTLEPVVDNADGSGEVDWTYSVTNAEIDFLGGGETVELTFTVTIDDQNGGLDTQDVVITLTGTNDAPEIDGLPGSITVVEDTPSDVDLSPATLTDVDAGDSDITLTVAADLGTMTSTGSGGVTVAGSGTGAIVLTGSVDALNAFLDDATNIQYLGPQDANGTAVDTLTLTANDGAGSGDVALGTVSVDIDAVNDAPTITGPAGPFSVFPTESITVTTLVIADVDTVLDPDGPYTVTLGVGSGTLDAATAVVGVTVTGTGTGTLTLEGTLAAINTALAGGIVYTAPSVFDALDVTFTATVSDNGNAGSGGTLTDALTFPISVEDDPDPVLPVGADDGGPGGDAVDAGTPGPTDLLTTLDNTGGAADPNTDVTLDTGLTGDLPGGPAAAGDLGSPVLFGVPVTELAAGLPAGTELSQFAALPELLASLSPAAGDAEVPVEDVELLLFGFPVGELALFLVGDFELSTIDSRDGVLDLVAASTDGGTVAGRGAVLEMLERLGLFEDGSITLAELQGEIDLFGLSLGEMAVELDGVDLEAIGSLAELQAALGNPSVVELPTGSDPFVPYAGAPAFTDQLTQAFTAFDRDAAALGAALTQVGAPEKRLAA